MEINVKQMTVLLITYIIQFNSIQFIKHLHKNTLLYMQTRITIHATVSENLQI